MAVRLKPLDRDTPMLLPPDLRDWVPKNHIVHFLSDVIVRYICGGRLHPDHDTLCAFRRKNRELFEKVFVAVLLMAQETAGLKKVGTLRIDGTKIKAHASKHSAVSYKHAGDQIQLLRKEVEKLTAKAEGADRTPLEDGLSIPEEIVRREDRVNHLEQARRVIEARYEEERKQKQNDYEEKKRRREELRTKGKKPRGQEPPAPRARTAGYEPVQLHRP